MRTAIIDIETSGFDSAGSIVLCAVIKEYAKDGDGKRVVFRGDKFPTWERNRSNDEPIVRAIIEYLKPFDIIVAHNGENFDKTFLIAKAMEYRIDPRSLRRVKSIDPVLLSRRYMRLNRHGLGVLINFLQIPHEKTQVSLLHWRRASHEGNRRSMDYIVEHCIRDVDALDRVYDEVRVLIDKIDSKGSQF